MASSNGNLTLNEANDEDVAVVITTNVPTLGTVLNISTFTLEAYLKTAANVSDTDPSTFKASTVTGEIVITDGPNGKATISFPGTAVLTSVKFWRCDVLDTGGKRKTAVYGTVTVVDL